MVYVHWFLSCVRGVAGGVLERRRGAMSFSVNDKRKDPPEDFDVEESIHAVGFPRHKPKDPRSAAKYNIFSRLLLM